MILLFRGIRSEFLPHFPQGGNKFHFPGADLLVNIEAHLLNRSDGGVLRSPATATAAATRGRLVGSRCAGLRCWVFPRLAEVERATERSAFRFEGKAFRGTGKRL